ncbi:hypothetical protein [Myxococcus sp. AB025B]|uniref:hypothetical protein n=1 Tax=Myxococcus sp. AB025B TaxID=2562794 RepID=UPI0011413502|nr:hypothetical protein [Myxococcus sp. AB025B]
MNSRLLVAFLCLAAVSSGCIIHDEPAYEGDVTFRWTLAGLRCDEDPDVRGVNIYIPGERLENDGRYPCRANGFDGIVLHRFQPGTYSFQLEAVSYVNEVLYEGSGTFRINGDQTVEIDLLPPGVPPSYAYLEWQFPGNASCNSAGVRYVDVRIDNSEWGRFDCEAGSRGNAIKSLYVDPGEHNVIMVALDSRLRAVYEHNGRLTTHYGAPTSYIGSMRSTATGVTLGWEFQDGPSRFNCSQAGVTHVELRIDGGPWERFSCSAGSAGATITNTNLGAGNHDLQLVAVDAQNNPWYYYTGSFSVPSGGSANVLASLWVIGGASIKWELRAGGAALSCSQAGINDVAINFRDVFTGELVYGIVGDVHGCNDAPVVFEFLRPGRYQVEMFARANNGVEYRSVANSVTVDVVGHSFPGPNNALLVSLFPN